MTGVVALDLPGGPAFVDWLQRAWDRGDAVFPVDQRLPPPARAAVLAAIAPTSIVDATGERALAGRPAEPGDALVMATSGTTGVPKGVILTHDAVLASARATSERLGVTTVDHWLACLPLNHVGGLSVVTRALLLGTGLTVLPGFDADAVRAAVSGGANLVSLVAAVLPRIDPSWFRWIVLGGGRPPAHRPVNSVVTYGLTETGSGVVYDGRPLPGVEVSIADDGEVLLRGPMLTRGYRDGTSPVDAAGWLHTGDVGSFDAHGALRVAGRRGDMIVTGGENVWPDPVEEVLQRDPHVAEVAVVGLPDPEWGQRVVAFVVPVAPDDPPVLADLRDAVRASLPAYTAPRELRLVASLPRTALGKVQRSELQRSARQ